MTYIVIIGVYFQIWNQSDGAGAVTLQWVVMMSQWVVMTSQWGVMTSAMQHLYHHQGYDAMT